MNPYNYHTHTTFSDGKNTPREMIEMALERGFHSLGISDHALTLFDPGWSVGEDRQEEYVREISVLKEEYRGRIRVFVGLEQDALAVSPPSGLDYMIGSVHWLRKKEHYLQLDQSRQVLADGIRDLYDGDADALAEDYYQLVAAYSADPAVGVIGHFDLITKFDEHDPLFLPTARYRAAWQTTCDKLLDAGKIFEINTGGISRGFRSEPYPSREILSYLGSRKAKVILSSDSHTTENLGYGFDEGVALAKKYGCNPVDLF